MRKTSKLSFYFSHLAKMSRSNKIRTALTSIGIFIAVFLFALSRIIIESFYESKFDVVNEMDDYSIAVDDNDHSDELYKYATEKYSGKIVEDRMLAVPKSIFSGSLDSKRHLTLVATVHGITGSGEFLISPDENRQDLVIRSELIEGRYFVSQDLFEANQVAIVDEFTASVLSPDSSCIGKTFSVGNGTYGDFSISTDEKPVEFTVVGVVKNNVMTKYNKARARAEVNSGQTNTNIEVQVYCPLSVVSEQLTAKNPSKKVCAYIFNDSDTLEKFEDLAKAVQSMSTDSYTHITTKEQLKTLLVSDLRSTRGMLDAMVLIFCAIAGLSIMSIIFFSLKERIPEIGIRKAFGATKTDIIFQFIFETVIIALLASVAASVAGFYVSKIAEVFIISKLSTPFTIRIGASEIVLPILIGVIEAIVCSIIPSFYAANVRVTDALKFE